MSWHGPASFAVQIAALTAGFGCVMWAARQPVSRAPRLGLRAAACGLLAPLCLGALSAFTQGSSTTSIAVFALATGTGLGALLAGVSATKRQQPRATPLDDPAVREALKSLDAELVSPLAGPDLRLRAQFDALAERTRAGRPQV